MPSESAAKMELKIIPLNPREVEALVWVKKRDDKGSYYGGLNDAPDGIEVATMKRVVDRGFVGVTEGNLAFKRLCGGDKQNSENTSSFIAFSLTHVGKFILWEHMEAARRMKNEEGVDG